MGAYIMLFPFSRILTLVPLLFFFFTVRLPALLMLGILVPHPVLERYE